MILEAAQLPVGSMGLKVGVFATLLVLAYSDICQSRPPAVQKGPLLETLIRLLVEFSLPRQFFTHFIHKSFFCCCNKSG